MRLPRLPRIRAVRFRFDRLAPAMLVKLARSPSYRAPRAADLHDPNTFQPPQLPPMSENERRLLDAVLHNPDADEPRLAYADWAERQGYHERAKLIRSQVQAHLSGASPERDGSTSDCGSAMPTVNTDRFAPWAARDFVVRRGFVEGMSLSGRAFISAGGALFRLAPLREVRLVAVQPFLDELARCPHLAGVRRLDLSGNRIGSAGARSLAGSHRLDRLSELVLSGNDLGTDGIAAVAGASWLPRLRVLEAADNRLGPRELEVLLSAEVKGLVELDLSRNPLGPEGAKVLISSRLFQSRPLAPRAVCSSVNEEESQPLAERAGHTSHHTRLILSQCALGPEGASALFSAARLPSLTELDVSFNNIGLDGAVALAEDESLVNLKRLNLGFNDVEDDGVEALAASDAPPSLVSLDLAGNRITAKGAQALSESHGFGSVDQLNLTTNPLGDAGAVALVRGEGLASLTRLNLTNCEISDAGIHKLAVSGAIGGLRALSLGWNLFGDRGVEAIAACPDLAALEELDLTGTWIGLAGARALAASRHLIRLRKLVVGDNERLPPEALAMLRERFGTITGRSQSHP